MSTHSPRVAGASSASELSTAIFNAAQAMSEVQKFFDEDLNYPRFLIMGIECSGKTALLEAVAGMPLGYKAPDTGTRCPVRYILIHEKHREEAKVDGNNVSNIRDVRKEVQKHMQKLAHNEEHGFSEDILEVEIRSPLVRNIILMDTPGLKPGGASEEKEAVERIVAKYARDPKYSLVIVEAWCPVDENPYDKNFEPVLVWKKYSNVPQTARNDWKREPSTIVVRNKFDLVERRFDKREHYENEVSKFKKQLERNEQRAFLTCLRPPQQYIGLETTAQNSENKDDFHVESHYIQNIPQAENNWLDEWTRSIGGDPSLLRDHFGVLAFRHAVETVWSEFLLNRGNGVADLVDQRIARKAADLKKNTEYAQNAKDKHYQKLAINKYIRDFASIFCALIDVEKDNELQVEGNASVQLKVKTEIQKFKLQLYDDLTRVEWRNWHLFQGLLTNQLVPPTHGSEVLDGAESVGGESQEAPLRRQPWPPWGRPARPNSSSSSMSDLRTSSFSQSHVTGGDETSLQKCWEKILEDVSKANQAPMRGFRQLERVIDCFSVVLLGSRHQLQFFEGEIQQLQSRPGGHDVPKLIRRLVKTMAGHTKAGLDLLCLSLQKIFSKYTEKARRICRFSSTVVAVNPIGGRLEDLVMGAISERVQTLLEDTFKGIWWPTFESMFNTWSTRMPVLPLLTARRTDLSQFTPKVGKEPTEPHVALGQLDASPKSHKQANERSAAEVVFAPGLNHPHQPNAEVLRTIASQQLELLVSPGIQTLRSLFEHKVYEELHGFKSIQKTVEEHLQKPLGPGESTVGDEAFVGTREDELVELARKQHGIRKAEERIRELEEELPVLKRKQQNLKLALSKLDQLAEQTEHFGDTHFGTSGASDRRGRGQQDATENVASSASSSTGSSSAPSQDTPFISNAYTLSTSDSQATETVPQGESGQHAAQESHPQGSKRPPAVTPRNNGNRE